MNSKQFSGFTLVELLFIIAIISMLAAIVLPMLKATIESTRRVTCANSLQQVGIGNELYRGENNGWLPVYSPDVLSRPHLYALNGQTVPAYYFDLWPDEIRWCPTIQTDEVLSTVGGANTIPPRIHYNPLMQWGYRLPQLDSYMVGAFWESRTYGGYTRTVNKGYSDYVRIRPGQRAKRWDGTIITYYGRSFDPYDAAPMACCPIWEYTYNGSTAGYLLAHSGGGAKRTTWAEPAGANSLWADGHVAWNNWPGAPLVLGYLAVATGYGGAPDGFFAKYVNVIGSFVARRNIK